MYPKPKTFRSEKYKRYIRSLPCLICGGKSEAAHTGGGGMGLKGPDDGCIPLCHGHHMESHRIGEKTFARKYRLDYGRITTKLKEQYRRKAA